MGTIADQGILRGYFPNNEESSGKEHGRMKCNLGKYGV